MKNFTKLFGFIALVAVIGFSMVACDDGNGGSGGSGDDGLTITGIPSEHNGKYAIFYGTFTTGPVYGCKSMNASTGLVTGVKISNGKITLPTFTYTGGETMSSYSGSQTVNGAFYIGTTGSQTTYLSATPTATRTFTSINFTNGSATVNWSQGQ